MNLKEHYQKNVVPQLMKDGGYTNVNAVPKIVKVVVHVGFGKISNEPKIKEIIEANLKRITGQKPVLTAAKKSISNFKVREGQIVGAKVTLRGARMYDFLTKLIHITLPRVRDFRGLPAKSLDHQGNLTIGFKEHIAFPEIRSDEVERLHGLEITIVSNAKKREMAEKLFKLASFPFSK
jgi:large subunit ribosomal protein L5